MNKTIPFILAGIGFTNPIEYGIENNIIHSDDIVNARRIPTIIKECDTFKAAFLGLYLALPEQSQRSYFVEYLAFYEKMHLFVDEDYLTETQYSIPDYIVVAAWYHVSG